MFSVRIGDNSDFGHIACAALDRTRGEVNVRGGHGYGQVVRQPRRFEFGCGGGDWTFFQECAGDLNKLIRLNDLLLLFYRHLLCTCEHNIGSGYSAAGQPAQNHRPVNQEALPWPRNAAQWDFARFCHKGLAAADDADLAESDLIVIDLNLSRKVYLKNRIGLWGTYFIVR